MPDLELGPDDYRVQTKSGRWVVRDYPWMLLLGVAVTLFGVGWAWWHRAELTTVTLFAVCAVSAFLSGMAFAQWVNRFD